MTGETRYLAYLLRLWVTPQDETPIRRVVLENPHTGERRAFATLEALFDYLGAATDGPTHTCPASEGDASTQDL